MKDKSFYDISYALTQLDGNMSKQEVDKALVGINFNSVRDEEKLILSKMVNEGETKAVKYLLDKKANPNLESSAYHYYKGPAILFALQNNRSKTEVKLEILRMLVDYGADINATIQWHDSELNQKITGNYIEYGLKLGTENVDVMTNENYVSNSRKSSREEIKGLQAMLSYINELGISISTETSKELDLFLKIETSNNNKVNSEETYKEALKKLNVTNRINDLPEVVKEVCYTYLENENFIPTKEWAELIKHIINISLTFEEVAKEVYEDEYEEGLNIVDDEGWLCQGWEEYNWFSEVIEILSNENSLKNPEWASLLEFVIKEHDKYSVDIEYEIEDLFEETWVESHPAFQNLKEITNQYFS